MDNPVKLDKLPGKEAGTVDHSCDSMGVTIAEKDFIFAPRSMFRVQLKAQNDKKYVDIRVWGLDMKDRWYPRKRGIFCEWDYFKRDILGYLVTLSVGAYAVAPSRMERELTGNEVAKRLMQSFYQLGRRHRRAGSLTPPASNLS